MDTSVGNYFDIGAKYGRVGAGVGSFAGDIANKVATDDKRSKVESLVTAYNSNLAPFGVTAGEGAKQSVKASRLASMLRDLDPDLSKQYETMAGNLAKKETTGEMSKAVLDARNKPEAEYTAQKGIYDTEKQKSDEATTKFLADEVAWKSVATDIEGLMKELADANEDLRKLQVFNDKYKDSRGTQSIRDRVDTVTPASIKAPAPVAKYQLPDFANYMQNKIGQ